MRRKPKPPTILNWWETRVFAILYIVSGSAMLFGFTPNWTLSYVMNKALKEKS